MKSKMFCFDATLVRKNVLRYLPLWLLYTLFWVALQPFALLNMLETSSPVYLYNMLLNVSAELTPFINFIYAILTAMLLFRYLTNARASSAMHALPIRRETLFLETYCTGILFMLVPQILVLLLNAIILGTSGALYLSPLLAMLAQSFLTYLFFFSLATFCFMLSSQVLVAPVLYLIFNFLVVCMEFCIKTLLRLFLFGMGSTSIRLYSFSPLCRLMPSLNVEVTETPFRIYYGNWKYLGVLALVGVALTVVSLLLFRKRQVEAAGDAITFRGLRPVFKYAMTFGFAIVLGLLLGMIFEDAGDAFVSTLICMLVSAFLGYFLSEMLLQKTVRVFRGKWLGFLICCLVIVLGMGCFKLDIYGFTNHVPEAAQVTGVELSSNSHEYGILLTDAESIDQTISLHRQILDAHKRGDGNDAGLHYSIRLSYRLRSGKTLVRYYDALSDSKVLEAYTALRNTEVVRLASILPTETDPHIKLIQGTYSWWKDDELCSYSFSTTELGALVEAIRLDVQENGLNWEGYNLVYYSPDYETAEEPTSTNRSLRLLFFNDQDESIYRTFWIKPKYRHVLAFLRQIDGIDDVWAR